MPQVVLATRNIVVYDGISNSVIGGCRQFGTTSISEFFFCLRMFIVNPTDFQLYHEETKNYVTENDAGTIQTGKYYVCSITPLVVYLAVTLTAEQARPRNISGGSPADSATSTFRARVRSRDRVCKVSGQDTSMFEYVGVEACHIIPRSHAQTYWFPNNLQQYLVDTHPNQGPNQIDSVQNGDYARAVVHAGTNVSADLLLEHFRQAVLANMKGAGKVQIYDIDPSEDSQAMSVFEAGEGKEYLESFMEDKLLGHENRNRNEVEA